MKYFVVFFSLIMVSCNNSKSMSNSSKDINQVGNYEVIFIAEYDDQGIAEEIIK